ncbi:hypothetical protein COCSADRAFT_225405 [Bipolaris sorokiniana ND90Pr]|uniref:Uncharacterized protein n=1 Tax=Cochliobolus sativus (strain ND90Pr / ATCC 201652) TaxID=665912 RepID=M2SY68_COCSN|nr:uncharacterized protein COCSADRAFT_225405 [Bipolaris sorokiniana ND90Pr]EMD61891.1 hypothetical protein COCSADRAFT_225405 [Bipolaris sorokiniana ND90Pr]
MSAKGLVAAVRPQTSSWSSEGAAQLGFGSGLALSATASEARAGSATGQSLRGLMHAERLAERLERFACLPLPLPLSHAPAPALDKLPAIESSIAPHGVLLAGRAICPPPTGQTTRAARRRGHTNKTQKEAFGLPKAVGESSKTCMGVDSRLHTYVSRDK